MKKISCNTLRILMKLLVLLILSSISLLSISQNIQPLGIRNGTYTIKAKSTSSVETFCMDESILTSKGTVYNRIRLGNDNNKIRIGTKVYTLQSAVDQKLISFVYSNSTIDYRTYETTQMFMSIKNNTPYDIEWVVDKDLVLSNKTSTNAIKSATGLNKDVIPKTVPRQKYIWFSHEYASYLNKNKIQLQKYGLINEGESPTLDVFLQRREDFLEKNGEKNKKIHKDDFTLLNLLSFKDQIRSVSNESYEKFYYLRYAEKEGQGFYLLDDGSPLPKWSQSGSDILSELNALNEKVFIGFDQQFPQVKMDAFLLNIDQTRLIAVKDMSMYGVEDISPFIAKNSELTAVGDIVLKSDQNFTFNVKYNAINRSNLMDVSGSNKNILKSISDWFKKLVGIKSPQSLGEIYIESLDVAKKAFPNEEVKTTIRLGYTRITFGRLNNLDFFKKIDAKIYVYNTQNH